MNIERHDLTADGARAPALTGFVEQLYVGTRVVGEALCQRDQLACR
jgi:hypothetical protein